jgi:hypothetical protein
MPPPHGGRGRNSTIFTKILPHGGNEGPRSGLTFGLDGRVNEQLSPARLSQAVILPPHENLSLLLNEIDCRLRPCLNRDRLIAVWWQDIFCFCHLCKRIMAYGKLRESRELT